MIHDAVHVLELSEIQSEKREELEEKKSGKHDLNRLVTVKMQNVKRHQEI